MSKTSQECHHILGKYFTVMLEQYSPFNHIYYVINYGFITSWLLGQAIRLYSNSISPAVTCD